MRHLATGAGHLRDGRARGSPFIKVKPCPIRPDETLGITVMSDRDVARYFGRGEWAGLKIDEQRDDGKTEAADRDGPPFPCSSNCSIRQNSARERRPGGTPKTP